MATQQPGKDALRIYQEVLDDLARATLGQDGAALRALIKLPCSWKTLSSHTIVEQEDDLIDCLTGFGASLRAKGVNQLILLASRAEFLSPDYIVGWHVSHHLQDATWVHPAYLNRTVLQRDNGVWRLTETESYLSSPAWPFDVIRVPNDAASLEEATKILPVIPDDVRREALEPHAIYQSFLDRLVAANITANFDAYCARLSFPYTHHTDVEDVTITTRDQVRPFFDGLCAMLEKEKITHFERKTHRADFLSGNRICGYHNARLYSGDALCLGIESRMIIERDGADWYLKSVTNAAQGSYFPFQRPEPSDSLISYRTIQRRVAH